MNPHTQNAAAVSLSYLLSTGETVDVPLPSGETVASVRAKVVLLDPTRPTSRTVQLDATTAINVRLLVGSLDLVKARDRALAALASGPEDAGERARAEAVLRDAVAKITAAQRVTVDGLFVDWRIGEYKGRTSLTSHQKEEQ